MKLHLLILETCIKCYYYNDKSSLKYIFCPYASTLIIFVREKYKVLLINFNIKLYVFIFIVEAGGLLRGQRLANTLLVHDENRMKIHNS